MFSYACGNSFFSSSVLTEFWQYGDRLLNQWCFQAELINDLINILIITLELFSLPLNGSICCWLSCWHTQPSDSSHLLEYIKERKKNCFEIWIIDRGLARDQDSWILAQFSFCVFMARAVVEVHKRAKNKNRNKRTRDCSGVCEITKDYWRDRRFICIQWRENDSVECLFSNLQRKRKLIWKIG